MESPPRRGPPPPSEPPPRYISLSGRVPPPKGAPPPEGARRARLPRQRPSNPTPVIGPKASVGEKRSGGARQRDDEQEANRRSSYERPFQSDEESSPSNDESSRGSLDDTVDSRHLEDDVHHSPGAAFLRGRPSRSPSDNSVRNRREDSADESSSLNSLSSSERPERRRPHHQADNRTRVTAHEGDSSRSESDCSTGNDDNVGRDGFGRDNLAESVLRSRRKGGSGERSRKGRRDWDPNSKTRQHSDDDSLSVSSDRGRTDSTSSTDSEGRGRREPGRRYSSNDQRRGRNKGSKCYKERNQSASDPEGAADQRGSYSEGSDSPPHTRIRRKRSGGEDRLEHERRGHNDAKPGRRRGRGTDHDNSDVEGYGSSSNKCGGDAVGSASAGNRSDQPRSPALAARSDDDAEEMKPTPTRDTDSATHTTNNTIGGAQRSSARSADLGKSLRGNPAAARSELSATDGSVSQTPRTQTDGVPATTGKPVKQFMVSAGKPIRGARWGEAIGVRSTFFDVNTIPTAKGDLKTFVSTPLCCGPGTVLRCFIERDRSGTHKFSHVFSLYADLEDGSGRLLLAARKLLASKTAHYVICVRQDDLFRESGKRGGASFLAKLRASSTDPTEYALYDSGENPTSAAGESKGDSISEPKSSLLRSPSLRNPSVRKPFGEEKQGEMELRKELGVITYNFDKKEQRTGKRRMEVAIPQLHKMGDSFVPVSWQPSDAKESMKINFGRIRYQGAQNFLQDDRLLVFHQRESRYDPLSSCLVDFKGRATAPSVKNFQLLKSPPEDNLKRARYFSEGAGRDDCESDDLPRPVYLQMGKVGKDCFNVDVEWPLSLLQAFAICLSRFDTNAHF